MVGCPLAPWHGPCFDVSDERAAANDRLELTTLKVPLRSYLNLLSRYLGPLRGKVVLLAIVLGVGICLQLLSPQLLRGFIDGAIEGVGRARLVNLAGLFILVALLQQVAGAAGKYFGEDIGLLATNELRGDLVAHCLGLDMAFWRANRPGELIERTDGDVQLLAEFFSQFVVGLIANLALLVGILAVLFVEDLRAGLAMTLFGLFALAVLFAVRNLAVPFWEAVRGYSARFFGFLGEHLSGTEDIQGVGAGRAVFHKLHDMLRSWYPMALKAELAGMGLWMTSVMVFAIGAAVSFWLGAYLYNRGESTIGGVYLLFHYTQLLRRPIEQIRTQMQNLQRASAGIVRIQRLLDTKPTVLDGPGASEELVAGQEADSAQTRPAPAVAFSGVGFSYEAGSEAVLKHIDFRLAPGRILGLLGRTGSGKTTIARLLLRLYDPSSGEVLLGGVPTTSYRLSELRDLVGMVSQEVELLSGTVRDNLTFFATDADDAALWAVLEELGLADWCRSLPDQMDTLIGGAGQGLSAGEAQLLGLARLFLRNPGLIVLDEASSRLDPATERLLERALDRLVAGRTVIIIAHRLATVMRADDILILSHGEITEHGERAALMDRPDSVFATLLRVGLEEHLA